MGLLDRLSSAFAWVGGRIYRERGTAWEESLIKEMERASKTNPNQPERDPIELLRERVRRDGPADGPVSPSSTP